jgi:hypothetical protein
VLLRIKHKRYEGATTFVPLATVDNVYIEENGLTGIITWIKLDEDGIDNTLDLDEHEAQQVLRQCEALCAPAGARPEVEEEEETSPPGSSRWPKAPTRPTGTWARFAG